MCVWLWAQGPPAAELVSEQGREGAARKVFCRPGEENRPLFLEEKNSRFFLQKYLFLPESELGGRVFEEMYYFLLFPCTQKNNTWTETLPKAVLSRWTGFRKARIWGGQRAVWFRKLISEVSPSPAGCPPRWWASLTQGPWLPLPGGKLQRRGSGSRVRKQRWTRLGGLCRKCSSNGQPPRASRQPGTYLLAKTHTFFKQKTKAPSKNYKKSFVFLEPLPLPPPSKLLPNCVPEEPRHTWGSPLGEEGLACTHSLRHRWHLLASRCLSPLTQRTCLAMSGQPARPGSSEPATGPPRLALQGGPRAPRELPPCGSCLVA